MTFNETATTLLGQPKKERSLDEIQALVKRFREEIPGCGVGGPLHIVVDDPNPEDHHLVWCLTDGMEYHLAQRLTGAERVEQATASALLGCLLLGLDETDRERVTSYGEMPTREQVQEEWA